ncbi:hypothetical protein [Actinomadura flavalba]|uniref:hypothetical protein n=1 Tax=Actinomadura flavalba TaxID=1120938 RepID=UPI00036222A9|nr:hypothetical protein [Actinomadura flavalba]
MDQDLLAVHGAEQLRRLARDLRKIEGGKEIRQQMVREMKDAARQLAAAEKTAVLALPSRGENARRGRRSLRRAMATATVAQVRSSGDRAGVNVRINPKRMPPGQHNLPAYLNDEPGFGRLRHPVFGTDTWVQQAPTPWFYATAAPYERVTQQRLLAILDGVAAQIERG